MSIKSPVAILYDENGNPIDVTLDGGVYRLETEGKVLNSSGTQVDPATEQKLEAVRLLLVALEAKDFSTETTLNAFLTAFNGTDFATQTTLNALLTAFNNEDFSSETTLAALKAAFDAEDFASEVTLAAVLAKNTEIDAVLDTIYTRQNDRSQKTQLTNGTLDVSVTQDASINRLEIQGKVQTVGAIPPPATTPVRIVADTPLSVGTHDTTYTIPTGETFHLQQITAGNEDPTKGAVVEVLFDDGAEHVIERVYTAGFTLQAGFADVVEARDGTPLLGAVGTSNIIVRRTKYSGSNIAIDAEVVGYSS